MKIKFLQDTLLALIAIPLFWLGAMAESPADFTERAVTLAPLGRALVSPVFTFSRPFNAVSLQLHHEVEGLMVDFGKGWEAVENHDDGFGAEAFILTEPTQTVRFKKPAASGETALTFDLDVFFRQKPSALADGPALLAGPLVAQESFNVIGRARWGADETMRYWNPDIKKSNGSVSVDPCEDITGGHSAEASTERVVKNSPSGDPLIWPLQYAKSIEKIIIHHTDSEIRDVDGDQRVNTRDYQEIVRAIYRFHTVTRGWGDIGYNFIIDPLGNVYEGRYGGDKVIGAHALCHNNGSVGIAVIGNYQENKMPEPAMDALIQLVGRQAQKYRIDPTGESPFRGKRLPNIVGHRDVRPTACPGEQLYGRLPEIRAKTVFLYRGSQFTQDFSVQDLDYNADPYSRVDQNLLLEPNERKKLTLQFKNTGKKTWDQNTWLHVALNNNPHARVVPLLSDKSFVAANLREYQVGPGSVGTFEMELEAGYTAGDFEFEVAPVISGRYKVSRAAIKIPFTVAPPYFDYQFVRGELPSGIIFQGEKISAWIELKNTGNVTWRNYGPTQITLGTESPRDHKSVFIKKNASRVGYLLESEVPPGRTGRFLMDLDVPLKVEQAVAEYFTPVIEGVRWLENKNLQFAAVIKKPVHAAQMKKLDSAGEMAPGQMRKFIIRMENRGDLAWNEENMEVSLRGYGVKVFKNQLVPRGVTVRKGQTVDLDFWVQAPYEAGNHRILLTAKFNKLPISGGNTRYVIRVPEPKLRAQKIEQGESGIAIQPGEIKEITVTYKNLGNTVWRRDGLNAVHLATAEPQDRESLMVYKPEWISPQRAAEMKEEAVGPGETATFTFKVRSDRKGVRREYFQLVSEKVGWIEGSLVRWDFRVFGEKVANPYLLDDAKYNQEQAARLVNVQRAAPPVTTTPPQETKRQVVYRQDVVENRPFRVKLSYNASQAIITSAGAYSIMNENGNTLFQVNGGSDTQISQSGNEFQVKADGVIRAMDVVRLVPGNAGIMQITSWERRPSWNEALNDNQFRGVIEVRLEDGAAIYINELPLEDYMKGLAEVSNSTPLEKQKAIAVLARSYARFYMQDENRKFPGKPYDGSDDPAVFQRYLGYGVEQRSPNFVGAVALTSDEVVTYQGKLIKTPYFSQSDGRTKSAEEVWGWQDAPYLKAVPDPWCEGLPREGHGVGLSGCGAEAQAKLGKTYDDIIKYYYQGVEVEEMTFK